MSETLCESEKLTCVTVSSTNSIYCRAPFCVPLLAPTAAHTNTRHTSSIQLCHSNRIETTLCGDDSSTWSSCELRSNARNCVSSTWSLVYSLDVPCARLSKLPVREIVIRWQAVLHNVLHNGPVTISHGPRDLIHLVPCPLHLVLSSFHCPPWSRLLNINGKYSRHQRHAGQKWSTHFARSKHNTLNHFDLRTSSRNLTCQERHKENPGKISKTMRLKRAGPISSKSTLTAPPEHNQSVDVTILRDTLLPSMSFSYSVMSEQHTHTQIFSASSWAVSTTPEEPGKDCATSPPAETLLWFREPTSIYEEVQTAPSDDFVRDYTTSWLLEALVIQSTMSI